MICCVCRGGPCLHVGPCSYCLAHASYCAAPMHLTSGNPELPELARANTMNQGQTGPHQCIHCSATAPLDLDPRPRSVGVEGD